MVANTNVLDAAFHTAHDFNGGVHALAQRMGNVSPNVLNKKVDPHSESHHLRLDESVKIQSITGDYRILKAMAFTLHHVAIPLPEVGDSGDMSMLDGFMDILTELGQFAKEFQADWADGRITKDELERIKSEAADVQGRLAMFVARITEIAES